MNRYTKIKDFHASRALGVGSSDIATLAGLNRHYAPRKYQVIETGEIEKLEQTTRTLWREKRGEIRQLGGTERMEWGHRLEGLILAKWLEGYDGKDAADDFYIAKIRGRSVGPYKTETECRMKDRPYVLAHADLLIDTGPNSVRVNPEDYAATPELPIIIEAKSSGCFAAKRKEGEIFTGYDLEDRSYQGIPDAVYLQVQWQMLAYDIPVAYVCVLIDTGDYREYGPIPAAPRVQEKCLALAERFWELVESGTPPKPETVGDVCSMWPVPKPLTAMISGEDELRARECAARYWTLGDSEKRIKDEREEVQAALGIYMGENAYLETAEGVKLASSYRVESVSAKGLADMNKKQKALIAGKPEIEKLYIALDEERAKVSERVKEIVAEVKKEPELFNALKGEELISDGYRAIKPARIKEG